MTPVPRTIDRYTIIRVIGEGGMGRVLLAEDPNSGEMVAIKHIHLSLLYMSNYRRRFEREIQIMEYLTHSSLMPLLDEGEVNEVPYYVMPYIDGVTVRDYLHTYGAFTAAQSLPVVDGICSALVYMHRHSVFHRDIKPHNILIARSGKPFLTDFGIAADYNAEEKLTNTSQRASLGTEGYVAPELRGGAHASPRSDVYSLGMTVYEMLARRSLYQALGQDMTDPFAPIPEPLQPVIRKAIDQTPKSRYQDITAFRRAFREAVRQVTESATTDPAPLNIESLPVDPLAPPKAPMLTPAFPNKQREHLIVGLLVTFVAATLVITLLIGTLTPLQAQTPTAIAGQPTPTRDPNVVGDNLTRDAVTQPPQVLDGTVQVFIGTPESALTATFIASFYEALTATATVSTGTLNPEVTQIAIPSVRPTDTPTPTPSPTQFAPSPLPATQTPRPSVTSPAGVPAVGFTLYVQRRTGLYQTSVERDADARLDAGTPVIVSRSPTGTTFYDDGTTRYYTVLAPPGIGWVDADDLGPTPPNPRTDLTGGSSSDDESEGEALMARLEITGQIVGPGLGAYVMRDDYAISIPGSGVGIEFLPRGAIVTVTEGPREVQGEQWWRVITPGGGDGWLMIDAFVPQQQLESLGPQAPEDES